MSKKKRPYFAVIVHGPKMCGKTRNAQVLVEGLGLDGVIDDWDRKKDSAVHKRHLHLTNLPPEAILPPKDVKVMSFDEAMRQVDEYRRKTSNDTRLNLVAAELGVAEEKVGARRGESPENQFQVGDVVTLKSGGAGMTVTELGCCASVECCWFEYGNEMQQRNFPLIALKAFASRVDEMPF